MDTAIDDALDLTTFWRMVAVALAYPWELIEDVAPQIAEMLARAWVAIVARAEHALWIRSFVGFGGST